MLCGYVKYTHSIGISILHKHCTIKFELFTCQLVIYKVLTLVYSTSGLL